MVSDYRIKDKKRNLYYAVMLFVSCSLMLWGISIFQKTMVPASLFWGSAIGVAVLVTVFDRRNFAKTYDISRFGVYLYGFFQNFISWGGIISSVLLLSNFYFPQGSVVKKKLPIVGFSISKGEGKKAKVTIDYDGVEKEFSFHRRFYNKEEKDKYKYVLAETQQGLLDWDIILSQQLEKSQ